MKAAPGSHASPRQPVLPTSNTYTDADTDMTSDDDNSSIQSSDSNGSGGGGGGSHAADPPAGFTAQMPNGAAGSFDGAFAAFNIGQH